MLINRFQGFFRRLLGMKAQILEKRPFRQRCTSQRQVAPGADDPILR
jgi:hypothetical protein